MLKRLCIGDWVRIGEEVFIVDNNEAGRFLRKIEGDNLDIVGKILQLDNRIETIEAKLYHQERKGWPTETRK